MLSLKKLKAIDETPADEFLFPAAEQVEELDEVIEAQSDEFVSAETLVYGRSWKEIFAEQESGIITGKWTDRINVVTAKLKGRAEKWIQTHLAIANNYNGN